MSKLNDVLTRVERNDAAATPKPWLVVEDERYGRTAEAQRGYVWKSTGPGCGAIARLSGPNDFPETVAQHAINAQAIADNRSDAPWLAKALRVRDEKWAVVWEAVQVGFALAVSLDDEAMEYTLRVILEKMEEVRDA